jgi:glyoxylase-like metal-dependent hydrolase (beta-lactamase superfamily II)
MSAVALHALHCGDLLAPPGWIERPAGPRGLPAALGLRGGRVRLPVGAFLLVHPDAGPVLVDTGAGERGVRDPRADLGRAGAAVFGGLVPPPGGRPVRGLATLLRGAGVAPEDVRRVVMTHLHGDHTGGMRDLPAARFTIAAAEWRAATGARRPALAGVVAGHLPPPERVDLVEPAATVGEALDVLGDGSVGLVATPGHSPGHLSVLVRTAGGGEVLLAGDAVYTRHALDHDVLPLLVPDPAAYARSRAVLRAFAAARPDVPVWPTHDAAAWAAHGA